MIDIENFEDCETGLEELENDIAEFAVCMLDFLDWLKLARKAEEHPAVREGPTGEDCIFPDSDMCNKELTETLERAREIFLKYN